MSIFAEAFGATRPLYLGLATLFLVLHALLIRRWAVGIFDPLFMLLVSNALGWAIVWFMFLRGDIASVYLLVVQRRAAGAVSGHGHRPGCTAAGGTRAHASRRARRLAAS